MSTIKATKTVLTGVNIPSKNGYLKGGIAALLMCIDINDCVFTERLVLNIRTKEAHPVVVGNNGEWYILSQRGIHEALTSADGTDLVFDKSLTVTTDYNAGYISECVIAVNNYGVCDHSTTWRHDDGQGENKFSINCGDKSISVNALSQALAMPNVLSLLGDSSLVDRYNIGFNRVGQFDACVVESLKFTLGPCSFYVRYFTTSKINVVSIVNGDSPEGADFRAKLSTACANTGIPCKGDPISAMSYHYSDTLTAIAEYYHNRWEYNSSGNIVFTGVLRDQKAAINTLQLLTFVTGDARLVA